MSGFLKSLVDRAGGRGNALRVRVRTHFEPVPDQRDAIPPLGGPTPSPALPPGDGQGELDSGAEPPSRRARDVATRAAIPRGSMARDPDRDPGALVRLPSVPAEGAPGSEADAGMAAEPPADEYASAARQSRSQNGGDGTRYAAGHGPRARVEDDAGDEHDLGVRPAPRAPTPGAERPARASAPVDFPRTRGERRASMPHGDDDVPSALDDAMSARLGRPAASAALPDARRVVSDPLRAGARVADQWRFASLSAPAPSRTAALSPAPSALLHPRRRGAEDSLNGGGNAGGAEASDRDGSLSSGAPARAAAPPARATAGHEHSPGAPPSETVTIHIGRIEVRAAPPPPAPSRPSASIAAPSISLDAYLQRFREQSS